MISAVIVLLSMLLLVSGGVYAATLALNFAAFGIGAFLVSIYGGVLQSRSHASIALSIGIISCFSAVLLMALNSVLGQAINATGLPVVAIGLATALLAASFFVRVETANEPESLAAERTTG